MASHPPNDNKNLISADNQGIKNLPSARIPGTIMPDTLDTLTARLMAFRDERDWRQFQGLKNLIVSLNLESAELLELTQWKSDDETENALLDPDFKDKLAEETADIFLYLLMICERSNIDLIKAASNKIDLNGKKYPADLSRGKATKYTEL